MFRILLAVAALCALATVSAEPPAQNLLADLPNVSFPAPHRIASGAVQAANIAQLKKAGVKDVINLRANTETPDFDEAAAMRKAGIAYHNLPISSPDDLTRSNVIKFDQLLNGADDKLTLVHCGSSNRVGAMIALRAAILQGKSTEDALAEGREWGLKSLQPAVRQRIDALQGEKAAALLAH
ncbi:MAG: sulfur transferase domain-containing protein [Rudaea sp.]